MRVGIVGGSIAGCAAAALLHRAGHDVTVFERSGSDLVSRGAGIGMPAPVWEDLIAHGLIDETLPACRAGFVRCVTRGSGTGGQRWLGDVQMDLALVNWAHLWQGLRRGVPGECYRRGAAVERIETRSDGTTLHLRAGGALDFDLVVCADGYRSTGRELIDPSARPRYRGIVVWRGLVPESDLRVDPLGGCAGVRPLFPGGHGLMYYVPGSGRSAEPGQRLLAWGCNLPVSESALSAALVDDQERQQSGSVPFGRVHPRVRAAFEARLADLLPPVLFELVRRSGNCSVHALCSVVPRSYARDRLCLVGDAGAVFPPFTGSGVMKAVGNTTSLVDALADASAVDDALRRWSQAQLQVAAQIMPTAELIERKYVFGMPDFTALSAAAANDWMFSAFSGFGVTLPGA